MLAFSTQNFFVNVIESQIGNTFDETYWRSTFDMLNLVFTALFTAELCVNLFVNWFTPFIKNGYDRASNPSPATASPPTTTVIPDHRSPPQVEHHRRAHDRLKSPCAHAQHLGDHRRAVGPRLQGTVQLESAVTRAALPLVICIRLHL
jgi:hypothetical protein